MWFANKTDKGIKHHAHFKLFPQVSFSAFITRLFIANVTPHISKMELLWGAVQLCTALASSPSSPSHCSSLLMQIECCIDEWVTGTQMDISFTVQDYCSIYDSHVKCLQEFDKATKEYGQCFKVWLQTNEKTGNWTVVAGPRGCEVGPVAVAAA